jgi:hypothetical protein
MGGGGEGCRKFESFVGNLHVESFGPPPEKVIFCHGSRGISPVAILIIELKFLL